MQVSKVNPYYTPYRSNRDVKAISRFSIGDDGKYEFKETDDANIQGFAEFIDYQEFHRQWMSQGATTAFSYRENKGLDKENNSISMVPGMNTRLENGFSLSISDYMVQAVGDFRNNRAASEATRISSAMSSLIKVANGQISMNMFYSSKTQNNSAYAKAGLEAFGIDTTRPFSINERQFYFNSEDRIVRVKNKVLKAWTFMGSRVAVNDRSAAERISMEMNVGTSFVTAVDAYKESHKLTPDNIKHEDDWRKMSDKEWDKLVEHIDKYLDTEKENLIVSSEK